MLPSATDLVHPRPAGGRPLTPKRKRPAHQRRRSAETASKPAKTNWRAIDWESVSLWNPEWKVNAPDFERTPVKLAEYHGKTNVLLMHPFPDKKTPASFERKLKVEAGKTKLKFSVAADDRGDWIVKAVVNGQVVKEMAVDHEKPRWKTVEVDLAKWKGQEVTVRLEGARQRLGIWSSPTGAGSRWSEQEREYGAAYSPLFPAAFVSGCFKVASGLSMKHTRATPSCVALRSRCLCDFSLFQDAESCTVPAHALRPPPFCLDLAASEPSRGTDDSCTRAAGSGRESCAENRREACWNETSGEAGLQTRPAAPASEATAGGCLHADGDADAGDGDGAAELCG
jgi:hypothetical protein